MSRSYKKQPFQAVCGNGSAKHDKTLAHRGERRAHKHALRITSNFEDFLLPHRLECSWNNTYSWGRDGSQSYQGLDARDWYSYLESLDPTNWLYGCKYYAEWPPLWYQRMMRK